MVLLKEKNSWDKKFVETHETLFNINSIYERHKDVAIETLVNASLYNQYYQNAIQKIRGLFSSKEDIIRLLLGNYMKENEILNRPLSKFQQDIAKALQLI